MVRPQLLVALALTLSACRCGDGQTRTQVDDLSVVPQAVEFGPTLVGTKRTAEVTLRNGGRTSLRVELSASLPEVFEAEEWVSVEAGSEVRVPVTFNPSEEGNREGALRVKLDEEEIEIPLSGEGVACHSQPCTASAWDEAKRACVARPLQEGAFCKSTCLIGGHCRGGTCEGFPVDCDDKNPCTADSCDESSGCVHTDATASCPQSTNPCLVQSCSPTSGCGFATVANGTVCVDGCVAGTCESGVCTGGVRDCDDGNPCTADSCEADAGCVHDDATASCPVPGPCYVPTCAPQSGCGTAMKPDGTACGPATCEAVSRCEQGSCDLIPPEPGWCNDTRPLATIMTGGFHTCRILPAGTVECWGDNQLGQLGDGTLTDRHVPTAVIGLTDVVELSAGVAHSCARTSKGDVYCWGWNENGEVGPTAGLRQNVPYLVPGLGRVVSMSANNHRTCVVKEDATVWCFGGASWSFWQDPVPTRVVGLPPAVQVATGEKEACALLTDSTSWCWGYANETYLGTGLPVMVVAPPAPVITEHGTLDEVVEIQNDGFATCARRLHGEVLCSFGIFVPRAPTYFPDAGNWFSPWVLPGPATQISQGNNIGCARLDDATVRCWSGGNQYGELGIGSKGPTPTCMSDVSGLTHVAQISANAEHGCVQFEDGGYRCWGVNGDGQLGDGTTTERLTP